MSFRPDIYGPTCVSGLLTVTTAGTSVKFNSNWSPSYDSNLPCTDANPVQYGLAFSDIVIVSNPTNAGGLWVVKSGGSKNTVDSVILYIPKGSVPVHLSTVMGGNRFAPERYALDADQDGDSGWANGVVS